MKPTLLTVLLLIGYNQVFAQQTDFQISYTVEQKSERYGEGEVLGSNSIPDESVSNLIIQLHNEGSFTTSEKEGLFTYHDLKNEMIFKYSADTLYGAVPLFSVLDYRIAEYKNRTFLTNMLQAGGVGSAFGSLANLESIFGIEDQKNNIQDSIDVKTIDNTKIYSFNNNELVRVQYSKTKVPNDYVESFAKFLTYKTEIHPSIKEDLVKTKLVPSFIQYSYTNVAIKTINTFRLQEAQTVKNEKSDILDKERFLVQRNTFKMGGVIDSMMNYTLFNTVQPIDSMLYFNEAKNLSEAGKNLSGLLRLFEYLLATGNQPTDQIREIIPKQAADSLLATFVFCLNSPKSKEEAESKILQLNGLMNQDIIYGYVMNIFAANYVEPIDQNESISYFYKALSRNPDITGAWLDLGKIYASRYSYDDAWKCFGIMLNLKSDHPMAQEIVDRKEKLKENYPDYFKIN